MNGSFFICQNIAEKLSNPKYIQDVVENPFKRIQKPNSYWQSYTFADGFAGIAYFFSAMHQTFPQENWNKIAQDHLVFALNCFKEHKSVNSSLFKGLSGISLTMAAIQKDSDNFQEFHKGIDDWLIEDVIQTFLMQTPKFLEETTLIPPFFYAFPTGLSGILNYLVFRKDHPYLRDLAQKCANDLAKIMLTKKRVGSKEVYPWYFTQNELHEVYRIPDVEGGYNTSMAYGVTGCLIALSSAVLQGIYSDSIYEAISSISNWMKNLYGYALEGGKWSWIFSEENKVDPFLTEYDGIQHTWLYGWPSVIKSLFFAGKALKNESFFQFSKTLCLKCIELEPSFFLNGSSFCLGAAGFLSTLFPIAKEINSLKLMECLRRVKENCLNLYDPNVSFGFPQFVMESNENPFMIESPSFFTGAAGIGLALLSTEERLSDHFIQFL